MHSNLTKYRFGRSLPFAILDLEVVLRSVAKQFGPLFRFLAGRASWCVALSRFGSRFIPGFPAFGGFPLSDLQIKHRDWSVLPVLLCRSCALGIASVELGDGHLGGG